MNTDIRNDFLLFKKLKDNPVHNCVDLSKRMIGTRDGLVYYSQNFRIDFENKMSSLAIKDTEINKLNKEIKQLKEDISNMYDEKVVRNILENECGLSKFEIDEILN